MWNVYSFAHPKYSITESGQVWQEKRKDDYSRKKKLTADVQENVQILPSGFQLGATAGAHQSIKAIFISQMGSLLLAKRTNSFHGMSSIIQQSIHTEEMSLDPKITRYSSPCRCQNICNLSCCRALEAKGMPWNLEWGMENGENYRKIQRFYKRKR